MSKNSEALKFNTDLLTNKGMLISFATLLAKKYPTPDAMITAANGFIQTKSQNGMADYATDYDAVLASQQVMQVYTLMYWNGFYKTTLIDPKTQAKSTGPTLVIAATLDPDKPYHIGLGRSEIIDPSFKALTLQWDKSGVQNSAGKLIFNLIPTQTNTTERVFSGTWTDSDDKKHLVIGTETSGDVSEKDKKLLPPGLVELLPLITALGSIVAMVGAVAAMLWIGKQWKEKNLDRAEKERAARDNPDNQQDQQDALQAQQDDQDAAAAQAGQADNVQDAAQQVRDIPDAQFDQAVRANDAAAPLPDVSDARAGLQAAAAEQQVGEQRDAAAALAEQVDPSPVVVREGPEGEGGGVDVDSSVLAMPEED
ncbi:hypothetical protein [uncultured Pelagimonas sp.]|uniref:hypothetical protein n=1 Tax=uncultured Pelagimonas sp. TaxID=1618102 RepID=UPI00262459D8|nr:hypothetical protein [uncultured Pelagimonas sp.]